MTIDHKIAEYEMHLKKINEWIDDHEEAIKRLKSAAKDCRQRMEAYRRLAEIKSKLSR